MVTQWRNQPVNGHGKAAELKVIHVAVAQCSVAAYRHGLRIER
jgi:hypothetical protein